MIVILDPADVLLVAEYYASNVQMQSAVLYLVHPGTGYKELACEIMEGNLTLDGIKVLVLAIGWSDVLDRSCRVQDSLLAVRAAVNHIDPAIIILVSTPWPWPTDDEKIARKLFRTTMMLREICDNKSTMQFVRASQEFVTLSGINLAMISSKGLTPETAAVFERLVTGKIDCGRLRYEYALLSA